MQTNNRITNYILFLTTISFGLFIGFWSGVLLSIPSQASFEYSAPVEIKVLHADKIERYSKINAVVTAYCPDSCDDPDCIMANGEKAHYGAAACPRAIPFGTKIKVGDFDFEFVCKDRLAKKYDDRFDIFLNDCENARLAGKQNEEITIYK